VNFRLPNLCQVEGKTVTALADRPGKFRIAGSFLAKRLIFAAQGGNSPRLVLPFHRATASKETDMLSNSDWRNHDRRLTVTGRPKVTLT
jgi:hypothetical protein